MVTKLLAVVGAMIRAAVTAPLLLEAAGVASVAAWAGIEWGAKGVFLVVGVACLAKSLEADLGASD